MEKYSVSMDRHGGSLDGDGQAHCPKRTPKKRRSGKKNISSVIFIAKRQDHDDKNTPLRRPTAKARRVRNGRQKPWFIVLADRQPAYRDLFDSLGSPISP
ncbi:uncharacterized protein SPSK_04714 [Sporothrix schenckii 1099-18]|uniref:Uncharacterized protein n=1 Tax=Sporothrix schenckii 1099-18 TaxID=1397361 RepID=A0A0F2M120_SPOSC|nr:uncharacterized protein SPSK_04714 [Sporothrix schenckii 1099-18]KJR83407.1 hypothetical protein SPSK_04714 [Sporothrix schenckii 1099-18]